MGKLKNLLKTQMVRLGRREAIDPRIWIFSSTDNRHYNYNSRYLFEYVKDHVKDITPYFVINDPVLREKLSKEYGEKYFIDTETTKGIHTVLKAGVWFTSAGMPVYGVGFRKKHIVVNLWHGVPLKKIALLDPNLGKAARIYFKKLFTENYTHILTTSTNLVPIMAKSFAIGTEKIHVWGQPRNDVLFQKQDVKKVFERIYKELPPYEKVILYAPTFRDYGNTRIFPFEDYDHKKLEAFLEKEKILLCIRTHISEKGSAEAYLSDHIRFLGNEEAEDIAELLNCFDVLVTDYSSIYIDYLLLDRPEIFLPYDKETYLDGRGMNFDYDQVTPGPKPQSQEMFLEELEKLIKDKNYYKSERQSLNLQFNQIQKPCCKRICMEIRKECTGKKEWQSGRK